MLTINNRIWKNIVSTMLITALILSGLFSYQNNSYGTTTYTTYETTTYYRLDTGVTFLWKNSVGTWQNGWEPGDSATYSTDITISKEAENVTAIAYEEDADYEETGYFPFEDTTNVDSDYIIWNATDVADNKDDYDYYYSSYAATPCAVSSDYTKSSGNLELIYDVTLNALRKDVYNVKDKLANGLKQEIIALLGSPSAEIKEAMDLMNPESENYNSNVEGYLYFLPVVIKYDIAEAVQHTINGFEPDLDVPTEAKAGEEFTVTDTTEFEDDSEFASSYLYYSVDGGSQKAVEDWDGSALCGSIEQSFDDVCTVTYTLTVWNEYGEDKSVSESIDITDNREITVNADLTLPEYTYEGHTELAKDISTFEVDGVEYSAARAYAEDIASNSFKCSSSYVDIDELTDTQAECTFKKEGTYSINLKIKTCTGGTAADTESIEVRPTPCIVDSLSGFQKQNREQILTVTVATTPGKPITDYTITLKDKKTGGTITLTPDNLQENNATIKTRSVEMTEDNAGEYTYITVEFLTKTPSYFSTGSSTQDFYYQIDVEDSKGDTDSASKTFSVEPDLPPTTAISLDSVFLRDEGSNTASITAEDVTVASDGDSVERTWYYGATTAPSVYTDVSTMDGYSKLSFGTDKIVGFNKVGVGKFTTKLYVKEAWTEPTLSEYVASSDYLTGTAIAYSDVQNVAPVVSLELLSGIEQKVLLLAKSDSEYQTLVNNRTALQQTLLANQIDGQIIIKKLLGSTPGTVTGIKQQLSYQLATTVWSGGVETETDRNLLTADSEKAYYSTWTIVSNGYTTPVTVHAYNPYSGEVWSHTTTRNEAFSIGHDDTGKYLYLIYAGSNQTVLLDKRTGTVAGTISMALSDKVWLSDTFAFIVQNSSLYAIDMNSLTKTLVNANVSAASRVNGTLQYITKSSTGVFRNTLDMETLSNEKELLIGIHNGVASSDDYTAVCIDSAGKAVIAKAKGTGTDSFCGFLVYDESNSLTKQISSESMGNLTSGYSRSLWPTLDEQGACNHVIVWSTYLPSSPNRHGLTAVNLNTGAASSWSKSTNVINSHSFSAMFEVKGTSYFYYNGWYYNAGTGYCSSAYYFTFNGTTLSGTTSGDGMIGTYDEDMKASDRIFATLLGNNSTGVLQMKISAFPKTLVQETAEAISRFADKFTFVGSLSTTADEIKETAETPKPVIKITAAQAGSMSLYNQNLDANKKYYYEYEIKPLTDGTENGLTGMAASTGTSTAGYSYLSDTYYVEDSYTEDFADSAVNPFFTASGTISDGVFDGTATFTVPAGKRAVVSFDYVNCVRTSNGTCFRNGPYVNREKAYINYPTISCDATIYHYTHYKLLAAGTNTVHTNTTSASGDNYATIDNLKVELVSATAPALSSSHSQVSEDNDWVIEKGSFETPNETISYGSQASSYYSGALSATVTKWYKSKYPINYEYSQTVPTGYLVKGFAYPQASNSGDKEIRMYITGHMYRMYGSSANISSGEKIGLDTLSAGTYTHSTNANYWYQYACIPTFDIIAYPSNPATIAGDVFFSDDYSRVFFAKTTSTKLTSLSVSLPKGGYLLKNLKVYYLEDGKKIYMSNEDCQEVSDISKWTLSSGLTAEAYTETETEDDDDEYVKIYKKGEKVLYNIYYTDYEDDPSKNGYWVYTHVNWPPDSVHPDAGKILNQPIDRFYLSGKYTVTHWEVDNTQRTGTMEDASLYNKESNKVTMTFYVNGEGEAPWITYIKTNPSTVKESNSYTIRVGVDDTEKDTLALETEVYLNGTLIKTDKKTGINADTNGDYPEQTITGLPTAKVGVYQVICTVSDYSGTGIKSYKFTVISDGKVTGFVNHTDQWDTNRKKYNLKRFSEEVNRTLQLNDYIALPTPRKRGTNVFWSGEKFMLRAEAEGETAGVTVEILSRDAQSGLKSTGYYAELADTGRKTAAGAEVWEGSLWNAAMINKWGGREPEELLFRFTARYPENMTKTHEVPVIMDSDRDYWQLHRLW